MENFGLEKGVHARTKPFCNSMNGYKVKSESPTPILNLLVSLKEAMTVASLWIVSLNIVCVCVSFCKNDSIPYTLLYFLSNSDISWGPRWRDILM